MDISTSDSIIESDAVIRAANEVRDDIEDLIAERDAVQEEMDCLDVEAEDWDEEYEDLQMKRDDLNIRIEDLENENLELIEFADDLGAYGINGQTLINEDYFEDYAKQVAQDQCNMDLDEWPFWNINWDSAAQQLQADYSEVEFGGTTFYYQ